MGAIQNHILELQDSGQVVKMAVSYLAGPEFKPDPGDQPF
jgi:hypothetical protein